MNKIVIRDLDEARVLDVKAMLKVRGGMFGALVQATSGETRSSRSLYDACCTGKHIPVVTLAV